MKVPLKLVHVVGALPAIAVCMLRPNRIDSVPPAAELENQGVFGSNIGSELGIPDSGEVDYRVLVLMLEQAKENERSCIDWALGYAARHVSKVYRDTRARLRKPSRNCQHIP